MTINAANKLIDTINEGQGRLPEPTMLKLIYFNIFEAISELEKDYMKAESFTGMKPIISMTQR